MNILQVIQPPQQSLVSLELKHLRSEGNHISASYMNYIVSVSGCRFEEMVLAGVDIISSFYVITKWVAYVFKTVFQLWLC